MLKFIKQISPTFIKQLLSKIKSKLIVSNRKKLLVERMRQKHRLLVIDLESKDKVKVVFLVIHASVWKVDSVFRQMLQDPYFDPEILICPYVQDDEERMQEDMNQAYNFFKNKCYPVTKSQKADGSWVMLDDIKPDIVFFTNPYKITITEYYENAYFNYLTCYIPYYFMATTHAGDEFEQYNNLIFLLAWKIYWPHEHCSILHKKLSVNGGKNGITYGYPATENLAFNRNVFPESRWRVQPTLVKKIIFAPHHTIEESKYSLSSFLKFGEFIKSLAKAYQGKIQWSFKPHPILKSKLYLHPYWGKQKTDAYYNFWKDESYTQLDEGDYDDLFLTSDAIIHDCSSFIVEYAFTGKPCLYLLNDNNLDDLLNEFGAGVMQVYEQAKTIDEIKIFADNVIREAIMLDKVKRRYFDNYVETYYKDKSPSERIINNLIQSIGALQ